MTDPQSVLVKNETIDDGILVYVAGDIEYSKSPVLRAELFGLLKQNEPERLILDLSGVAYMDSSGIATIVETLQFQRRLGNKLVLCSLQTKVTSMFEIANLDSLFTIVDSVEKAKTV